MKKVFYIFNIFLILSIVYLLSKVSYKSNEIKTEISQLKRKINEDLDEIIVLQAEWAYLTNPKRIRELSEKYLNAKLQSQDQFRKNEETFASNNSKK